jgi:hypothetical protein
MPSQAMQDLIDAFRDRQKASASQAPPTLEQRRAAFAPAGRLHPVPDDVPVSEVTAGGVPAHWLTAPGADAGRVLLFLHGGGYELGSLGGAVPLGVTSESIGGTGGLGGAVPLGDGRGRVVAGLESGWGAAGSGMVSSLGRRGPPQRPRRPHGLRPAGTLRRRTGGRAAASRRPGAPASAAGGRGPGRPLWR